MELRDFETLFPHVDTEKCVTINPLDALESHFFSRRAPKGVTHADYRELALDAVRDTKTAFCSTGNNHFNLIKAQVRVTCFYCGGATEVTGGGGNNCSNTTNYRCLSCGAETSLSLPTDGFAIRPKQ